jgi:hypothetical protein
MLEPIDIEVILRRLDLDRYSAELRINLPDKSDEIRTPPAPIGFDFARLRAPDLDSEAYGRELGTMLFADPGLATKLAETRAVAASQAAPLRMRMSIALDAGELHALRWEMLRDPQDEQAALLTTGEQLLFSRYLSSSDWRPARLRPKGDLRALVAIANPSGLERYHLAPVDVDGELERATAGLGAIPITSLRSGGSANLNNILAQLREGYDILYLVAHGALVNGESWVWLEDESGGIARASGTELARHLQELAQRPRLVVLVSCQSAGTGEQLRSTDASGALAALGPRLAEAGIPAVIAMQGSISMATVARFMPVFFQELQRDGQIDRAMAVARGAVRDRDDFWMPALFMRLKDGRIWYVPGFTGDDEDEAHGRANEKWNALIASILDEQCTPIIGPDLLEALVGSRRDLARELAEDYRFPLAPHDREGLPQVGQFLSVNQSMVYLPRTVVQYLCKTIRARHGASLAPDTQNIVLEKTPVRDLLKYFDEWLTQAWVVEQERNPAEPHRVLAGLSFPIYITADPSNLLIHALQQAGKDPQVMFCPWNEYTRRKPMPFDDASYEPTPQRPLVYRLFGSYQEHESLVLTEDSHFDYLIGVTQEKDRIPARLRYTLANTALLFLGFRPDDWDFRVFFRSLMGHAGGERRLHYAHVAVQVAPEEGRMLLPKLARKFLEDYFVKGAVSIYWGQADDFVRVLHEKV